MKVLTIIGNGSEDTELVTTVDILRRGGVEVILASIDSMDVKLSHGFIIKADTLFKKLSDDECLKYDALFIPGGKAAFTSMHKIDRLFSLVKKFNEKGKIISSICAAPSIFGIAGVLDNKKFTCFDGFEKYMPNGKYIKESGSVKDENIITGRSMNYTVEFGLMLLEALTNKDTRIKIANAILRNE